MKDKECLTEKVRQDAQSLSCKIVGVLEVSQAARILYPYISR